MDTVLMECWFPENTILIHNSGICIRMFNNTQEIVLFNTCNQNQGQAIDCYVTEPRMKAQSCEYEELKDSLIRDQIVVGTSSTKLQEKMDATRYESNSAISNISVYICWHYNETEFSLTGKVGALHEIGGTEPVNVIKWDSKRKFM